MKRYGHIYHKIYDLDNIRLAHKNARRRKAHYREVQEIDKDPEKYIRKIHEMLKNKEFENSDYKVITRLTDSGKVRDIYKLPYFPDRIVQHAIMQVLEPIWYRSLIRDTYSAIKNRGIHDGVERIKKGLRNEEETKYCLKMDVKKFYPSIDNQIMKQIIRKKIKDPNVLDLLDEIIDSTTGIPIGNYLSQYLGNLYLSDYDHWMKEVQKCKYYYRYCDDIVIFDSDKSRLHELKKLTDQYMEKLKLKIKGNWQVFPVDSRGVDFLGYRFFHGYTLLRKSIARKFKSKIKQIRKNWKYMSPKSIVSSIMSYLGWMAYANCKNLINAYIDDFVFWIVKQSSVELGIDNPLQGAV